MWLPHLAEVEWMTDVVSRHADVLGIPGRVTAVRLLDTRLTHPHRPESPLCRGWATCVVATSDAPPLQLYVKGFPDAEAADLAWQEARAAGSGGGPVRLPAVDLLVWRFPDDPLLTTLPELVEPGEAARLLPPAVREVLGGAADLRTTVVRYQPEASATLRIENDSVGGPAVFAKHLADRAVADVAARHQALWSVAARDRRLLLAEPLAADPERGVLWTRGVVGAPLTSAVAPSGLPEATASLGAMLAALHTAPVEVPHRVTVDDLVRETRKKADKIARAHPAAGSVVSGLATAAADRRGNVRDERVSPLHGDFHLDQLVASPEGPVLVDLDSMVQGPPEVDLAEFLVDLALRGLPGGIAGEVADGLLSGYAADAGDVADAALLGICADAEFVNRCYRHLRRHAPGWEADLETELGRHDEVRSLLAG